MYVTECTHCKLSRSAVKEFNDRIETICDLRRSQTLPTGEVSVQCKFCLGGKVLTPEGHELAALIAKAVGIKQGQEITF